MTEINSVEELFQVLKGTLEEIGTQIPEEDAEAISFSLGEQEGDQITLTLGTDVLMVGTYAHGGGLSEDSYASAYEELFISMGEDSTIVVVQNSQWGYAMGEVVACALDLIGNDTFKEQVRWASVDIAKVPNYPNTYKAASMTELGRGLVAALKRYANPAKRPIGE